MRLLRQQAWFQVYVRQGGPSARESHGGEADRPGLWGRERGVDGSHLRDRPSRRPPRPQGDPEGIPPFLLPQKLLGQTLGEVEIVADMHQRNSEMAKHADAFVALPGGYGTMEELLELITWSQLGIHDKPVGLLNVEGYYDSLLALLDKGVDEGFIQGSARRILVDSPRELLSRMEEYEAVHERVATRQRWEVDQLSVSASQRGDTQIFVGPSS